MAAAGSGGKREIPFVAIETSTICNQRCSFCPVSTQGRPKVRMDGNTLDRVVEELRGRPVRSVYLNGFNEPTLQTCQICGRILVWDSR